MKVNYDLFNRLINTNIKPAAEYFKLTEDSLHLINQIDFAVKQIIVCLNPDTFPTIKALLSSLMLKSNSVEENKGWLKAVDLLNAK